MFQYVTSLMKQGYHEESSRQHQLAVSPKERPDKRSTALWESCQPQLRLFYQFHTEMWLCTYYIFHLLLYLTGVCTSRCLKLYHRGRKERKVTLKQSTLLGNLNCAAGLRGQVKTVKKKNGWQNNVVVKKQPFCNWVIAWQHNCSLYFLSVFRSQTICNSVKLEFYHVWAI